MILRVDCLHYFLIDYFQNSLKSFVKILKWIQINLKYLVEKDYSANQNIFRINFKKVLQ